MASGSISGTTALRICLRVTKSRIQSSPAQEIGKRFAWVAKPLGISQTQQGVTLKIRLGLQTRAVILTLPNESKTTKIHSSTQAS